MTHRAERSLWPAIITPAQHQQLLATFARKTTSGRRVPRRYVLSGMLRCGTCGGKLFSSVRGETRRYVCMAGPNQRGCGRLTIVAAPVEEWITEAVLLRLDSPEMADALAGRTAADDRSAGLNAELQSDQAQMIELSEFYAAKGISILEWKAAREPIEARIYNTNRQLAQISGSSTLTGLVGNGAAGKLGGAESKPLGGDHRRDPRLRHHHPGEDSRVQFRPVPDRAHVESVTEPV